MTARARRPTQDGTGVHDHGRRRVLFGASPGDRVAGASESWDHDATEVTPRPAQPPAQLSAQSPAQPPIDQATPTELTARPERSEPLRVISMKDRTGDDARPRNAEHRVPLHVQLRSMAEVAGLRDPRNALGRLAPPHDPRRARRRRQRDNAMWACVAIVLACGISLGIWLIAGR
jgi:hypothetical protein